MRFRLQGAQPCAASATFPFGMHQPASVQPKRAADCALHNTPLRTAVCW